MTQTTAAALFIATWVVVFVGFVIIWTRKP